MERPLREARIDLSAISQNIATIRALVKTEHLMAVVKAGGYGHGAYESARAALAGGADWLGLSSIDEALELRSAGLTAPMLAWLHDPDADFSAAIAQQIDIGVSSLEQLEQVVTASELVDTRGATATPAPATATVQLKVDTGLSRNGAIETEWPEFFAAAAAFERAGRLHVRGVWSHLANAGEGEDLAQVAGFERAIVSARRAGLKPELLHLAATAGALRVAKARYSLVRIGIGGYGLSPFDDCSSAELGLRPALELSAAVVSVKRVPAGVGVSYGYSYRTTRPSTLVLVPLGYGDGVPRQASGRGPVWINGRTYTVAGRVAMDQIIVDVGDDAVAVGDRAILFGDAAEGVPSADDWARAADTINYEIVTRLGGRVQRTYRQ